MRGVSYIADSRASRKPRYFWAATSAKRHSSIIVDTPIRSSFEPLCASRAARRLVLAGENRVELARLRGELLLGKPARVEQSTLVALTAVARQSHDAGSTG